MEVFCVTHLIQFHIHAFTSNASLLLSLRPLDVEFMRRLSKVVNIVPVIAKADTLTLEERDFFKKKVTSFWLHFLLCSSLKIFLYYFISMFSFFSHLIHIFI